MSFDEMTPNVAREAYEQSLFEDMAEKIVALSFQNLQIAKGLDRREDIIVELRQQAEQVGYDHLTRLLQRAPFEQTVRERFVAMERNSDRGRVHNLLVLDLDNFKLVNDTYGHAEGDRCLREVGTAIKDNLRRNNDFACRWGGEELAVILGDTDHDGALEVAQKIQEAINEIIPGEDSPEPMTRLGVSIGIAQFPQGSDLGLIFRLADEAMYEAKNSRPEKNEIMFARQSLERPNR